MKEIVRTFNGHEVRVVVKNGREWFLAQDVEKILEIQKSGHTYDDFPEKETEWYSIPVRSENGVVQNREVRFVSESGLYRLIFKSRKPEAEKFQEWVYEEVLPYYPQNRKV
jgi:prophage antirepressor-like protein